MNSLAYLIQQRLIVLAAAVFILAACGAKTPQASEPAAFRSSPKVGVLLASHGDIDDLSELEDYIKTAFRNNVGIPLPDWIRGPITDPAYWLSVKTVRAQYEIIGPTRYRSQALAQVEAVNRALAQRGLPAKAYFGANFATPAIATTLDLMRTDGIETLIVFNKGAQFSYASAGENMDDVLAYLNEHPDWDVQAIGQFQYSEDERFREVFAQGLERDVARNFRDLAPEDVCLLIGSHGLPAWLTDRGDPAIRQMQHAVDWLRPRLAGYRIYHGYLNDDFFPGAKWARPDAKTLAKTMRDDGCRNVLLDGRLSFTNHHRATLYDLNYVARGILEKPTKVPRQGPQPNQPAAKVVLAPNFDDDPSYAALMAELTAEALAGQGDILVLKERGRAALPKGTVSTPGAFADKFSKYFR